MRTEQYYFIIKFIRFKNVILSNRNKDPIVFLITFDLRCIFAQQEIIRMNLSTDRYIFIFLFFD